MPTKLTLTHDIAVAFLSPQSGAKYSHNLYRWLTHERRHSTTYQVFNGMCEENAGLWIGFIEPWNGRTYFVGRRLIEILTGGRKSTEFCYTSAQHLAEIPDFWPRYREIGVCAIDTKHLFYSDGRWEETSEDRRTCFWCGAQQVLHRWQETIDRHEWRNAP